MISHMRMLFLLLAALPALAQETSSIVAIERRLLPVESSAAAPAYKLHLTVATLDGGKWTVEAIDAVVRVSIQILSQCGVSTERVELVRISAPARYRNYFTPLSRELARALPLEKPAVYFVDDTRQRAAFDAEAIGRGNSRGRPELADTVWVTHGMRDPGVAVAHELVHVLMDSGEHSEDPDNLMRDETAPQNIRLTVRQCARLREAGVANGLLGPP